MIVYLLYTGTYEDRALVGVFSDLPQLEQAAITRAFRGLQLNDVEIQLEGVDGAEVPESARNHLDDYLRARGVFQP